jgi:hypothetical protein
MLAHLSILVTVVTCPVTLRPISRFLRQKTTPLSRKNWNTHGVIPTYRMTPRALTVLPWVVSIFGIVSTSSLTHVQTLICITIGFSPLLEFVEYLECKVAFLTLLEGSKSWASEALDRTPFGSDPPWEVEWFMLETTTAEEEERTSVQSWTSVRAQRTHSLPCYGLSVCGPAS